MSLPRFDVQGSLFESLGSIAADLFDEKDKYKVFATKIWPLLAGNREELAQCSESENGRPGFAQQSVQHSSWANQFYQRQRDSGKSHHSAIRALAFKWIRIICACWKANKPYDESFYLQALAGKNTSLSST